LHKADFDNAWSDLRISHHTLSKARSTSREAPRHDGDLAAWLGLVPRQHSTGGRSRLLGISKRGDPYLRRLFVHGGRAVLSRVKRDAHQFGSWLDRLEARSPRNVVIIAMANKIVRIAWTVLTSGQTYRASAEVMAIT